jgi:hypothetical protein
MAIPKRLLVYLWAGPASLLGLLFVPLAWISGGQVRIVTGVIEISGGLVTRFLQNRVFGIKVAAMTLGHVVLGCDEDQLASCRQHERVHVGQYERWGPLMIPLYVLSSCWARVRGGHLYWDNRFEQEAYAEEFK